MSEFTCKHCGHKISIPDAHTSIKGTCPNCKGQLDTTGARSVYNLTILDVPQLQENQDNADQINDAESSSTKETDMIEKRRLP
jgi:transcription initiation factor IIE alpha subunit